uniref:Polyamine oxidase-like n=1 Tax=Saccoglossus kowalevskii TaxID=10224 RepID=A0ABM0MAX6_SACKO
MGKWIIPLCEYVVKAIGKWIIPLCEYVVKAIGKWIIPLCEYVVKAIVVEVGANWIQPNNENLNPVVSLAKKYKLKGKPSNWDSIIFRNAEGKNVTREALVVRHQLDKSLDYTHDLALELLENNKSDMSIRAALRLAKWNPRTPIDEVLEYLRVDFEYGGIAYVTSLKSTAVVVNDKDLFVTDQRGYSVLIKKMSNEFMKQGDLRLRYGKVVTAITWTNNSVTVRCQDDSVYTAPFALITFSIGVLQNDVIKFDFPLPTWKMLEIKQFEMALYTKIFLKFPKNATRFWDEQEFILHAHPRRGFYPVWQNLEAPGLFDVGTNILMVTVTGEESKRLEGQNDNVIRSEVMNVLRHMYGDNIPDVEEIMLHRWSRDPLYFGAYSNWPVEVSIGAQKRLQANL